MTHPIRREVLTQTESPTAGMVHNTVFSYPPAGITNTADLGAYEYRSAYWELFLPTVKK
ncbi:MAG: hypothetical protein WBV22_08680 [Anaerolineaceae bacterium]